MKKFIIFALLLNSSYVYNTVPYIFCIDGGGSKTVLQVINAQGTVLPLVRQREIVNKIETAGSNIKSVGIDGARQALYDLIDDTTIENDKALRDILSTCLVVSGMAGMVSVDSRNTVIKLFEELGIHKDRLLLTNDATLALQLVPGDGAILIAGTGSICLGKKGNERYQVGGLGYLLGDEGSGYAIGLQALKAALAHEYGWGKPTSLTSELCKLYNVQKLKNVLQALYKGKVTSSQIAHAASIVLAQAAAQDNVAIEIVNNAAAQLCDLVTTMTMMGDLSDCQVHVWGGLFKSNSADSLINIIQQCPIIQQRRISLVNQAYQNATTLFAQQNICIDSESQDSSWQAAQKLLGSCSSPDTYEKK